VNFQAGMQQPGILQPAEADSPSIGRRRFTEEGPNENPDPTLLQTSDYPRSYCTMQRTLSSIIVILAQ
jgi:hypothetical protein